MAKHGLRISLRAFLLLLSSGLVFSGCSKRGDSCDSSDAATIGKSNAVGVVTARSTREVTGSATSGVVAAGVKASTAETNLVSLVSIAVTPTNTIAPLGVTEQMTATGTYSDSSKKKMTDSVAWASSDNTIATINAAGLVTSVAVGGPVRITATSGDISASASLTVGPRGNE